MRHDMAQPAPQSGAAATERSVAEGAATADFLTLLSHEVRTAMTVIIGMSELALQTSLDLRQRRYVDQAHRAALGLQGLLDDAMHHALIDADRITLEPVPFSPEALLEGVVDTLSPSADDKGLELLLRIGPGLPAVLVGDAARLRQVLLAFGRHAIKVSHHGEVAFELEALAVDGTHAELRFHVSDCGGLPEAQARAMLAAMRHAPQALLRRPEFYGLGLVMGRRLVALMGGELALAPGRVDGSTLGFVLRLPLAPRDEAVPVQESEVSELDDVRMLVVDDNAAAREILCAQAQGMGLRVAQAADGEQALARIELAEAEGDPYKLVLMDWRMPRMDGVDCLAALRERACQMPAVIMVTAHGRQEALAAAAARGLQPRGLLTKPVTAAALFETVAAALVREDWVAPRRHAGLGPVQIAMRELPGRRVLLVEDNGFNREIAMELLSRVEVGVVSVANGRQALDLLAHDTRFDALLMDCEMPVMDGYEATRRLRADPRLAHLPVIAMTASALARDRAHALEAGMNDHLTKPIDAGVLFSTLHAWAGKRVAAPAA